MRMFPLGLLFTIAIAACSSESDGDTPRSPSEDPKADTAVTALEFVAPCNGQACGTPPSSGTSSKAACVEVASACTWKASPDTSVSFRPCADAECGAKPDASVCPSGTTFSGATCGSENEGRCAWHSACSPPPSTTPCAGADGCGPKPELGVICKDGSTGDLVCMQKGASCGWQRSCE